MDLVSHFFQIVIAIGIANVWIFRLGRSTSWRGGDSQTLREEFEVYGIPFWFMIAIGFSKITLAVLLVAGIRYPWLTQPAAIGMSVLMTGAVGMHIKVGDPLFKAFPALAMLAMSLFIAVL